MLARLMLSTAVAALLLAAPALAQQPAPHAAMPPQAAPGAAAPLSPQDRNFAKDAAIGGMAEVDLGNVAEKNGQNDQVKQFGAKMVQDHTAANNELQSIAGAKGIQLPQQLDKKHQDISDRLSKMTGAAFDRAYMADMVKDHNEDIVAFRHEAQAGRDPELKQFAAKTLQVIQQHDQMAHEIDRGLTASGAPRAAQH